MAAVPLLEYSLSKSLLISRPLLSWWTPYWSHCGKTKRQWSRLLNSKTLLRVTIVALACGSLVTLGFRIAFPLLPLANLWWLVVQIPALFVLIYGGSWLHRAIPERISLFDGHLLVQHGETAIQISKSDLIAARIVIFTDDAIRLRIWYTHR